MQSKDKIKKKLQELRISQTKLAELSGLAFGTVNRILNGKQELLPNTLARIANALEISTDNLADDAKEVLESEVLGFIEWNGEIRKIKSFGALKKLVSQIEYEAKILPNEARAIIAANKRNKANVTKNNEPFNFRLDWENIDEYDAAIYDCWAFKTADDAKDGITLDLGNQCSGYPFTIQGHTFHTSESAYLCGQFSSNTEECISVQNQLLIERNGYIAKKRIKNTHTDLIRKDWEEIRADWMLYVIWAKCRNKDFADKLLSIPRNAIILENSTTVHESTNVFWGSSNKELEDARDKVARYTELQYQKKVRLGKTKKNQAELAELIQAARNEIHYIGKYSGGHNYMGKILKRCQIALLEGNEPNINYDLFKDKKIYLLGELLF